MEDDEKMDEDMRETGNEEDEDEEQEEEHQKARAIASLDLPSRPTFHSEPGVTFA